MTLIRRPDRMSSLPDVIDRLFRDPFGAGIRVWDGSMNLPPVDVRETGDAYVVEAELPGLRADDIDVEIDGNTLTIRGQFGKETNREEENSIVRERRSGSFIRSITLPSEIDTERTTSSYENGELRIELPKSERAKARRIQVTGAARSVGEGTGTTARASTSQPSQPSSSESSESTGG